MPARYSTKWLFLYRCKNIIFSSGDNGIQLFFEAEVRGITWLVMRPKSGYYWFAVAKRKGETKTLTDCYKQLDSTVELDPLYRA